MLSDFLLENVFKKSEEISHIFKGDKYYNIRIKPHRDTVSFDSVVVDYASLCNFKVYSEQGGYIFIPRLSAMYGKKLTENFKEVDLTSVINVGLAECFLLLDELFKSKNAIRLNVFRYLAFTYPVVADDTTYLKLAFSSDGIDELSNIFKDQICVKHKFMYRYMYRFKPENTFELRDLDNIRYYLDALAHYNAQSYAIALSDLLSFLMNFKEFLFDLIQLKILGTPHKNIVEFCTNLTKCKWLEDTAVNFYSRFSDKDYEDLCFDIPFSLPHMYNELSFGKLGYRYNGHGGKISDARQFAIALVGLLGYGYLSCNSNIGINFLNLDYLQFKANSCLGSDIFAMIVTDTLSLRKDGSIIFNDWRKSLNIDICKYEEFVVWKKFNKSSLQWKDIIKDDSFDCDYFNWSSHYNYNSIVDFIMVSALPSIRSNLLDNLNKSDATIKKLNKEVASLKLRLNSSPKETIIDNLVIEQKDALIEELKKQIEELERINVSKSNIIANKSDEIDSLNNKLSQMFGDDYTPEESTLELSQAEKIKYLNDFNFLFVNGLVGFEKSLQNIGLCNYRVIKTCGTSSNITQAYKADFVIFCTNFISHAVCNTVKSIYGTQAECCYYTGTNIDKMIDFMYDYVSNFFK